MQKCIEDVRKEIVGFSTKSKSAWDRGVRGYAEELFVGYVEEILNITDFNVRIGKITEKDLLNGASNWREYSWGGCSEIYDGEICKRLCSPSEIKRTKTGELPPNKNEQWLDVQTRALQQAARLVLATVNRREEKC
jgi:hypothetical protein